MNNQDERLKAIEERLDKIERALDENNSPGIGWDVRILRGQIDAIKKRLKEAEKKIGISN